LEAQVKSSGSEENGGPTPAEVLRDAPSSGVKFGRSFVQVLRSISGIKERAVCSSRSLDLFLVSSCFESGSDGEGLRSAVDCLELEGFLPRSLAAAAGSVCSMKKKGKIDSGGLMRLLGHIHLKLDRVLAGVTSKPTRRRKRVRGLGFADIDLGRVRLGLVLKWAQVRFWILGMNQDVVLGLEPSLD
jgi:hypothetical protein